MLLFFIAAVDGVAALFGCTQEGWLHVCVCVCRLCEGPLLRSCSVHPAKGLIGCCLLECVWGGGGGGVSCGAAYCIHRCLHTLHSSNLQVLLSSVIEQTKHDELGAFWVIHLFRGTVGCEWSWSGMPHWHA